MSKYELDDTLVRRFAVNGETGGLLQEIRNALEDQIPIPAPELAGAIVKTKGSAAGQETETSHFMRWTTDNFTHSPWIEVGNHEVPWRTDQIGRIIEVLSPGRDIVIH